VQAQYSMTPLSLFPKRIATFAPGSWFDRADPKEMSPKRAERL
jgi:hypothetical protein